MARVLFLDDSPARLRWARTNLGLGNHLDLAETAGQCCELLRRTLSDLSPDASEAYDLVFLDHDLGGETYVETTRGNSGSSVVRWIVRHRPPVGRFVVHSLNTPAANGMVADLRAAGYEAQYINFMRLVETTPWVSPS